MAEPTLPDLDVQVTYEPVLRVVCVHFGESIREFSMTPEDAEGLAVLLIQHARAAREEIARA